MSNLKIGRGVRLTNPPTNSESVPEYLNNLVRDLENILNNPIILNDLNIPLGPPFIEENQAYIWKAVDSGTQDGQSYGEGDVLLTSDVGGSSKTTLLLDHSAL